MRPARAKGRSLSLRTLHLSAPGQQIGGEETGTFRGRDLCCFEFPLDLMKSAACLLLRFYVLLFGFPCCFSLFVPGPTLGSLLNCPLCCLCLFEGRCLRHHCSRIWLKRVASVRVLLIA